MAKAIEARALSVAAVLAVCVVGVGCGKKAGQAGTLIDDRDGRRYKTVKIGRQTWMAENLNYQTEKSWCYGEDGLEKVGTDSLGEDVYRALTSSEVQANCDKYGRLYTWDAARTACPASWHLPSEKEWKRLVPEELSESAKKLKSASGWIAVEYAGTDDYGFSLLPGGGCDWPYFYHAGGEGNWWTSTGITDVFAVYQYTFSATYMNRAGTPKDLGFSVRCVAD